jgi:hypothetical protein
MNSERVKLIIKNMELLLAQLKLEYEEEAPQPKKSKENFIDIRDLLRPEEYDEPDYYEESDDDLPNVSVRWRKDDVQSR